MTTHFDPLADMIDLRDVIEDAEMPGEDHTSARNFLRSMLANLGYATAAGNTESVLETAEAFADNEPTVIARRYFVEYAQELADDLGMMPRAGDGGMPNWPLYCIDWEMAARELEHDYSTFTYDGREYLIRSF